MVTIDDVLGFWFGSGVDDAAVAAEKAGLWWDKSSEVDRVCTERFGDDLALAADGGLDDWAERARGRLALIVLLDQLSRNIHRQTPAAFAQDAAARRLCHDGLGLGHDRALRCVERVFFYMPLEHSELLADQKLSVKCYQSLLAAAGDDFREVCRGNLDYACRHLHIIERFGRFPHRNAILGRTSTREEADFLEEPGSSF